MAKARDLHLPWNKPFVMFGHGMGALLAYEVAREILMAAMTEPRAVLVSGRRAAQLPSRERKPHGPPRDESIAEIKALNGTPAAVFEHEDLAELAVLGLG